MTHQVIERKSVVDGKDSNPLGRAEGYWAVFLTCALSAMFWGVAAYSDESITAIHDPLAKPDSEVSSWATTIGDAYISETKGRKGKCGAKEDVEAFLTSRDSKQAAKQLVDRELSLPDDATGERRAEARLQLRRLWWVAAPELIDYLGNKNGFASEAAREALVMMRSEAVVNSIIQHLEATDDKEVWIAGLYALGMMTEKYDTMIANRTVMGEKESRELAERVIKPFLEGVKSETVDPDLLKVVNDAYGLLEEATDRRWHRVDPEDVPEEFRSLPLERTR